MRTREVMLPLPSYENKYEESGEKYPVLYVYHINRDALFEDLFQKLTKTGL